MVHKCVWRGSLAQGAYSYVAHPCLYAFALRDEGREFEAVSKAVGANVTRFWQSQNALPEPSPTALVITVPLFL